MAAMKRTLILTLVTVVVNNDQRMGGIDALVFSSSSFDRRTFLTTASPPAVLIGCWAWNENAILDTTAWAETTDSKVKPKRYGGLASKIRDVANKMVRFSFACQPKVVQKGQCCDGLLL